MKIGLDSNVLVASVKKLGEPHHVSALQLSKRIKNENVSGVSSSLALIEIPGALTSSSKMPIQKIYEVSASFQDQFNLKIMDFESCLDLAIDLMFEFRCGMDRIARFNLKLFDDGFRRFPRSLSWLEGMILLAWKR